MSRVKRIRSMSGIYHVMLRGVNKEWIFHDDQDRLKMLEVIDKVKAISEFELFAYCFMNNHIHLLLKETEEEAIGTIMKRISVRYVMWFNKKYDRIGHLFQDRYKSECVNDELYYLVVLRYIIRNPVKAGVVDGVEDYRWSSYRENMDYFRNSYSRSYLRTSMRISLEYWSNESQYQAYMNLVTEDECLEFDCGDGFSEAEVQRVYSELLISKNKNSKYQINKVTRDLCIKEVKDFFGISIRELSQILGIGKGIVERAVR